MGSRTRGRPSTKNDPNIGPQKNPRGSEVGTSGIEQFAGLIREAYNSDLFWPNVFPLYDRIRRSDAEIGGIVRPTWSMFASRISSEWELHEDDSSDDAKRAAEYANSVMNEAETSQGAFIETLISYVPFMGWGWWEIPLGLRNGKSFFGWRSQSEDGLLGIRDFAFRHPGSFYRWGISDRDNKLHGMWQQDRHHPTVFIPLRNSLHLTFGDPTNPEGLSPLEAVWRLERIKFAFELIYGIGAEHTAGHLSVNSDKKLDPGDENKIREIAQAVMSAVQGNYAAWPEGLEGHIESSPFAAAPSLLEAIRYYGILKLQVFNLQYLTIATTAGVGAYSAISDASEMAVTLFNGVMRGFAEQVDKQIGNRLFNNDLARQAFPGMIHRPKFKFTSLQKSIGLDQLTVMAEKMFPIMPISNKDWEAIRTAAQILPTAVPPEEDQVQPETVKREIAKENREAARVKQQQDAQMSMQKEQMAMQERTANASRASAEKQAETAAANEENEPSEDNDGED